MNKLEIPNLDHWRAGELLDETMMNDIQDAQSFLLDPPRVKVQRTTSLTVSHNSFTAINWTEALEDNCKPFGIGYATAMWDPNNSSRLTAQVGGWYELNYTVAWNNDTDNSQRQMMFDLNGGPETNWQRGRRDMWHISDYTVVNTCWPVFMNAGDYVRIWVWQDRGSNTSLVATTPELGRRPQAKLKWVSL